MKIKLSEESIAQARARKPAPLEGLASLFDRFGDAPPRRDLVYRGGVVPPRRNLVYRGGDSFIPKSPGVLPAGVTTKPFQTPTGVWSFTATPNANIPSATGNISGVAKPQMSSPLPSANPQAGGIRSGGLEATPKFSQPKSSLMYGSKAPTPPISQQLPTQFKTPYTTTQIKSGGISTIATHPGTSLNLKGGTPTPTSVFSGGQGNLPFMNPAEVAAGDAASRAANVADIQRTVATQKAAGTYKPGTAYELAGSSVKSEVKGIAKQLQAGNITRAQAVEQVRGLVGQKGLPKVNLLSIPTANSPGIISGNPLVVKPFRMQTPAGGAPPVAAAGAPVVGGTAPVAAAGAPTSSVAGAVEKAGASTASKAGAIAKGVGKFGVMGAAYYGADKATQAVGNLLGLRDPNKEGPQTFDTVAAPASWGAAEMGLKAGSNIIGRKTISQGLGRAFGQGAVSALAYSGGSKLGGMAADALGIENQWGRLGMETGGGVASMLGANMAQRAATTAATQAASKQGLGAVARLGLRGLGLGLRALGPVAAVAGAAEAGWSAGRAIGNEIGGSETSRARTAEMGVLDLTKETLGLAGSDAAREQEIQTAGEEATKRQQAYFASGGQERLAAGEAERKANQGAAGDQKVAAEYKKLGREKFLDIYGQKELDTIRRAGLVSENYKGKIKMNEKNIKQNLFETIQQITSTQTKTPAAATLKPNPGVAPESSTDEVNPTDKQPEKDKTKKSGLYELYLNKLQNKLEESEGYKGINQAAYGYNPAAGRKTARLAKRYDTEPMVDWSGDTSAETPKNSAKPIEKVSNPDEFVSQEVKSLMSKAQEQGIELSHGRAQEIAIKKLKKHLGQQD